MSKVAQKSASASSQVEPPPWESPQWQESVSQNPGLAPFFDNLESFVELPGGVKKLRAFILDLAVRGKVVDQDPDEETAEVALKRILEKKQKLAEKAKKRARPNNKAEIEPVTWEVPNGWVVAPLSDLLTVINGRAYKKDELLSEGTPVLRVGNLFTSNHWYYSDLELGPEKYCDEGDLIFAWSASFGPFIWPGPKVIYHFHIWKLEFHSPEDIERDYLHLFLQQKTEAIKQAGHGVSMVHMTKGKMELLEVPFPPLAEQRRIVSKVSVLLSQCDELSARLRSRQSTTDALLHQILNGADGP